VTEYSGISDRMLSESLTGCPGIRTGTTGWNGSDGEGMVRNDARGNPDDQDIGTQKSICLRTGALVTFEHYSVAS
jgi:hypothetical protein